MTIIRKNEENLPGNTDERMDAILSGGNLHKPPSFKILPELLTNMDKEQIHKKGITYLNENGIYFQTYEELLQDALKIASALQEKNVRCGDVVKVCASNKKEFIQLFWGTALSGAVVFPVEMSQLKELEDNPTIICSGSYEMKEIKNCYSVCELLKGNLDTYSKVKGKLDVSMPAVILMTSGSTGEKKQIVLSHGNLISAFEAIAEEFPCGENEMMLGWLLLTHAASLNFVHLNSIYSVIDQVQIDTQMVLNNPQILIEVISRYKITRMWSPNSIYSLLWKLDETHIEGKVDLSSVRYFFNSGEQIDIFTLEKFSEKFQKYGLKSETLIPQFGMTELVTTVINNKDWRRNCENGFVSVGTPIPSLIFRVVDENRNIVKCGEKGRLEAKGNCVFIGNMNGGFESRGADEWFPTGDIAFISNQQIFVCGRTKEIVIVNGKNYTYTELEGILLESSGEIFSRVICSGYHKNIAGTDGILFFCVKSKENHISRQLENRIAIDMNERIGISFDKLLVIKESDILYTSTGKIDRQKMAEEYIFKKEKDIPCVQVSDLEAKMRDIWIDVLKDDSFSNTDKFYSIGGNSLNSVTIVQRINEAFSCEISLIELLEHPSVSLMCAYLEEGRGEEKCMNQLQ